MTSATATPGQPEPSTPPADCDASQFFRLFFAELEQRGIPCVVLHSYRNFPGQIDSDVDYAVRDADVTRVHAILGETAAKTGWLLVQTLQYDIGSYYSVVVNPRRPGTFLKLDRCSHYTRNGCLFIRDDVLLAERKKFNGFSIPCASSEFIYTLAKVFAKRKAIAGYLPRLRELSSAEPERSEKLFHSVFGAEVGPLQDWFTRSPETWQQLSVPMHQRNRYRLPQRLLEWRRRLRRILRPTGLRAAFLGSDDAQIAKVISQIETLQAPCFRRQLTLRFAPATQPAAKLLPPRNAVMSWLTVGRYFFRQWFGYLFRELPACRRSTSVITAGNFDDLLLRPASYRLRNSAWLVRLLRPLLPQPDFTFILDTESQAANPLPRPSGAEGQVRMKPDTASKPQADTSFVAQAFQPAGSGDFPVPGSQSLIQDTMFGCARRARHRNRLIIPAPDTETAVHSIWRQLTTFLAQRDQPRWKTSALHASPSPHGRGPG